MWSHNNSTDFVFKKIMKRSTCGCIKYLYLLICAVSHVSKVFFLISLLLYDEEFMSVTQFSTSIDIPFSEGSSLVMDLVSM